MEIRQQVTILGVKKVEFESDGNNVKGVQVHYISQEPSKDENVIGFVPAKAWLDLNTWDKFKSIQKFPYNSEVILDVDLAKGKLKPRDFLVK